jgi:hypothetical protein
MRNYQDLQVWEKAHKLTLTVYKGTQGFPKDERFGLTSQIRRSCASYCEPGRRLWPEIGWRDGAIHPDFEFQAQSFHTTYCSLGTSVS